MSFANSRTSTPTSRPSSWGSAAGGAPPSPSSPTPPPKSSSRRARPASFALDANGAPVAPTSLSTTTSPVRPLRAKAHSLRRASSAVTPAAIASIASANAGPRSPSPLATPRPGSPVTTARPPSTVGSPTRPSSTVGGSRPSSMVGSAPTPRPTSTVGGSRPSSIVSSAPTPRPTSTVSGSRPSSMVGSGPTPRSPSTVGSPSNAASRRLSRTISEPAGLTRRASLTGLTPRPSSPRPGSPVSSSRPSSPAPPASPTRSSSPAVTVARPSTPVNKRSSLIMAMSMPLPADDEPVSSSSLARKEVVKVASLSPPPPPTQDTHVAPLVAEKSSPRLDEPPLVLPSPPGSAPSVPSSPRATVVESTPPTGTPATPASLTPRKLEVDEEESASGSEQSTPKAAPVELALPPAKKEVEPVAITASPRVVAPSPPTPAPVPVPALSAATVSPTFMVASLVEDESPDSLAATSPMDSVSPSLHSVTQYPLPMSLPSSPTFHEPPPLMPPVKAAAPAAADRPDPINIPLAALAHSDAVLFEAASPFTPTTAAALAAKPTRDVVPVHHPHVASPTLSSVMESDDDDVATVRDELDDVELVRVGRSNTMDRIEEEDEVATVLDEHETMVVRRPTLMSPQLTVAFAAHRDQSVERRRRAPAPVVEVPPLAPAVEHALAQAPGAVGKALDAKSGSATSSSLSLSSAVAPMSDSVIIPPPAPPSASKRTSTLSSSSNKRKSSFPAKPIPRHPGSRFTAGQLIAYHPALVARIVTYFDDDRDAAEVRRLRLHRTLRRVGPVWLHVAKQRAATIMVVLAPHAHVLADVVTRAECLRRGVPGDHDDDPSTLTLPPPFAEYMRGLRHLELHNVALGDTELHVLSKNVTSLVHLSLHDCAISVDRGAAEFAAWLRANRRTLRTLHMDSQRFPVLLDEHVLPRWTQACAGLEELTLIFPSTGLPPPPSPMISSATTSTTSGGGGWFGGLMGGNGGSHTTTIATTSVATSDRSTMVGNDEWSWPFHRGSTATSSAHATIGTRRRSSLVPSLPRPSVASLSSTLSRATAAATGRKSSTAPTAPPPTPTPALPTLGLHILTPTALQALAANCPNLESLAVDVPAARNLALDDWVAALYLVRPLRFLALGSTPLRVAANALADGVSAIVHVFEELGLLFPQVRLAGIDPETVVVEEEERKAAAAAAAAAVAVEGGERVEKVESRVAEQQQQQQQQQQAPAPAAALSAAVSSAWSSWFRR
ncbi:hypothetical protein AMAG_12164 [Allomyces macrogynus ATCC 38327]|uniref:Uncharacterized protein n=1 Tax=Allomyces macrogynus (strain ATCC 38327) TaxID=578462 RepID=A0A0L0SX59_ALLM3|nr:hypothetical protein AMAG_12164 [Allomyces macrogynus ATCC 38327]|eukprot:KNE67087.1 hypothetical protein AMAG_12164 [Allomyces macrogynus ATCC 38327]